jgi:hypothetical protein
LPERETVEGNRTRNPAEGRRQKFNMEHQTLLVPEHEVVEGPSRNGRRQQKKKIKSETRPKAAGKNLTWNT